MTTPYTSEYHSQIAEGSRRSAGRILPLVFQLRRPASVVDVGCGSGTWLRVCRELGVTDLLGIDGPSTQPTEITPGQFVGLDLSSLSPQSLRAANARLQRPFDLAVCMEVAEHLPESVAAGLVGSLCSLAPVVLFSAALPNQGGTGHINEQLASYWASLFQARGHIPIDVIRRQVWSDDAVEWWYRQNTLIFAHPATIRATPALAAARSQTSDGALDLIHPIQYARAIQWVQEWWQKAQSKGG